MDNTWTLIKEANVNVAEGWKSNAANDSVQLTLVDCSDCSDCSNCSDNCFCAWGG